MSNRNAIRHRHYAQKKPLSAKHERLTSPGEFVVSDACPQEPTQPSPMPHPLHP